MLDVGFVVSDPIQQYEMDIGTLGTDALLYTAQVGGTPKVAGLVSKVTTDWGEPGPGGDIMDSPTVYRLSWFTGGRMVTGFTRRVARRDLAKVHAEYGGDIPGSRAETWAFSSLPGKFELAIGIDLPLHPPMRRTEYYNDDGGTRWDFGFFDEIFTTQPYPDEVLTSESVRRVRYQAGQVYRQTWNKALLSPAFPRIPDPAQWVSRTGDTLTESVPLYSDSGGHAGGGGVVQGNTFLYRDGVLFATLSPGSWERLELPPQDAQYRMVVLADRLGSPNLSRSMTLAWTFRSGHVAGDKPRMLPLSEIRFRPRLDIRNTAPAGRTVTVPISVKRQYGAGTTKVRTLTVEVSYNNGGTWTAVPVQSTSDGGSVQLSYPAAPGYVSLRASMTDTDGNTAELTVIQAYRIG
jgi:hypothetical protein